MSFTATFTDTGRLDTHTAYWTFDGVNFAAVLTEPSSSNGYVGSANLSHSFTATGVYDVSLTVKDDENVAGTTNTVNGITDRVVIYDPNAGFVPGGGTINTVAGSMPAPNNLLTGQSNFGFVSQYKKTGSAPSGETEFQFKAGNINFHSTSYDWLVVNAVVNDAWSQYQGTGTINNQTPTTTGDVYKFYVASQDGEWNGGTNVDKFRMKIWEQNSSGGVVRIIFDNQWGAPDTAGEPGITPFVDLTTPLTGGDINLHKTNSAQVTGAPPVTNASVQPLTPQQLAPIVQQAIKAWIAAGIDTQQIDILRHIGVNITNLPSPFVGMSSPEGIWIDQDAAGYGWFVDPTLADNREFGKPLAGNKLAATPGSPAYGKMDLLTIVEHEMGRPLGLQESPDALGIMANKFQLGMRELPNADDLSNVELPHVRAQSQVPPVVHEISLALPSTFNPGLGIMFSPIGIFSGEYHLAPPSYSATSVSLDSNQAVLSAVLADRTAVFDFGARISNFLVAGRRNDLLNPFTDKQQEKINDQNEFWTNLADSDLLGANLFTRNWRRIA